MHLTQMAYVGTSQSAASVQAVLGDIDCTECIEDTISPAENAYFQPASGRFSQENSRQQ